MKKLNVFSLTVILMVLPFLFTSSVQAVTTLNDIDYEQGVILWWKQQGIQDVDKRLEYFKKEVVPQIKKSDYEDQYKNLPQGIKSNTVLGLHPRLKTAIAEAEKVYPFRIKPIVFTNSSVYFGVFGLTYLAVSQNAIEKMTTEEFKAAVFHEYAHLLFLPETIQAAKAKDFNKIKELEIVCDLTAIYLLKGDLQTYSTMLEKSGETDENTHPSLDIRKKTLNLGLKF